MQGFSTGQVAQLLSSIAAERPSELAWQEKLRSSQEEIQQLRAILTRTNATLQAITDNFNSQQDARMRVIAAYTALKRTNMMTNMQAMIGDYLPTETAASEEDITSRKGQLVNDVTELHNTMLGDGTKAGILTWVDAASLYSNTADTNWLLDQLQHDITQHQCDVWSQ